MDSTSDRSFDSAPGVQLLLVDADPVFRLGFKTGLLPFTQIQVVAEAASSQAVLELLPRLVLEESLRWNPDAILDGERLSRVNLVVLDIYLGQTDIGTLLCEQLKTRYPTLPILILTAQLTLALQTAQQLGIEGYWQKGTAMEELVAVMEAIVAGEKRWAPQAIAQLSILSSAPAPSPQQRRWSAFASLRQSIRASGLTQMSARLTQLERQRRNPQLSWLERQVLAGREREIWAAQWLVRQLPAPELPQPPENRSEDPADAERSAALARPDPPISAVLNPQFETLKSLLLDAIFAKISTSLDNQTRDPLEIDILNRPKKQELFTLILKRFEDLLDELRFSEVSQEQLLEKRSHLLTDLWQATITDFFGKYLTLPQPNTAEIEIVTTLLRDQALVCQEILDPIPQVIELLSHLLFQTPLLVNNATCAVGSPDAMLQAQALLENLVVQLANGVMQPLLNRFATHEVIKQRFYDRRLLSTRDIERFRNALSWKYRLRRLVFDPQNMFESQFLLIILGETGLKQMAIYATRDVELRQLSGIPFIVTLALETRDAIAPPLQATFTVVGRGVVYLLTQVVGRGLGLIGRGILQGVGTTWQDVGRRSQQKE
jgi:DNA-binding NarL/FixJ family response regulator